MKSQSQASLAVSSLLRPPLRRCDNEASELVRKRKMLNCAKGTPIHASVSHGLPVLAEQIGAGK